MRRKKQERTAAELAAARERLGWSRERMSEEIGVRGTHGLLQRVVRLPGLLRPPRGPTGEYRRWGLFMGGFLTVTAAVCIGVGGVMQLLTGNAAEPSALEMALALPLLAAAYLAGGYVAGAVWDATRRIRHRLIGYVLRGGGTAAAMYGAMMLMLPLLKQDDIPVVAYLAGVGALTVFGTLWGAGKWMKDRWTDDLPEPPGEQHPA